MNLSIWRFPSCSAVPTVIRSELRMLSVYPHDQAHCWLICFDFKVVFLLWLNFSSPLLSSQMQIFPPIRNPESALIFSAFTSPSVQTSTFISFLFNCTADKCSFLSPFGELRASATVAVANIVCPHCLNSILMRFLHIIPVLYVNCCTSLHLILWFK